MGLSGQHRTELLAAAGVPREHGHRVNGDTPSEFAADAVLFAEQLEAARAMLRKHEQERKLLDERHYQAVEAALKTAQDSPWLDAEGCARYLGVSVKWVHAKSGPNTHGPEALPFCRVGRNGSKRFDKRELDKWVRKHG